MGSLGGPGGRLFLFFLMFFATSKDAKMTTATMIYHIIILLPTQKGTVYTKSVDLHRNIKKSLVIDTQNKHVLSGFD